MAQDNQPDLQVEGWLKTLGIESLCQWDMLVFLYRHQSILVSTDDIALFVGYATAEVVAVLDSLESSGLVERSRVSQGVRLYQLTATGRPYASRRLGAAHDPRGQLHCASAPGPEDCRAATDLTRNKNDFPVRGVKGTET